MNAIGRALLLTLIVVAGSAAAQQSDGGVAMPATTAPDALPKLDVRGKLGKGVDFVTPDGDFRLNIRGRMQIRFTQLSEDEGGPPDITEFQARRVRLVFQGHAKKELQYYFQFAFSNLDTEPDLRLPTRDAYLTWSRFANVNVRAGQMKVPYARQRVTSSSAQQLVDRSIVVGELNLDRDVGAQLMSKDLFGLGGRLGYNLGVFHGDGRNRLATAPGILLAARVNVRPFGEFEDQSEADFDRVPTPKLAVGLSVARNRNTNRQRSTFGTPYTFARFDYNHAAADLMFKWRGFSFTSEALYRHANSPVDEGTVNGQPRQEFARNAWGYFVQAGYLFNDHLEAAARFGELRPVGTTAADLRERQRELGGGINWYFQRHDLKIQSDYFYLYPEDASQGRHQIRIQAQLYY